MSADLVQDVKAFIAANQTGPNASGNEMGAAETPKRLPYAARAELTANQCAKDLWNLMETKKTNLCVAADVATAAELIELADKLGPEICILKTHCDLYPDFDDSFGAKLLALAAKHDVFIQSHLSESCDELAFSQSLFPDFPTDATAFAEYGLLRSPSLMAHCVHLQPGEAEARRPREREPAPRPRGAVRRAAATWRC